MHRKLSLKELEDFLAKGFYRICIVGRNFISLGIEDHRGIHGWKVEVIYKHNLRTMPIELIAEYQMPKIIFTKARI